MEINYCTAASSKCGVKTSKVTIVRSINALKSVVINLSISCEICCPTSAVTLAWI